LREVQAMKRFVLTIALLLLSSAAFGAPTWKEKRDAQKLVREGQELVKQGDFKTANEKFEKADQIAPSPSYKYERAKMLVELGEFLKAAEVLREASEMKVGPADRQGQQTAVKFLAEVEERTPKIEVKVVSPEASKVRLTIDGDAYNAGEGAVHFNPGAHEVVAESPGYERWTRSVTLTEQKHEIIEITMQRPAAATTDAAAEPGESKKDGISPIPAFVAWGVGAVGIALGIGFGVAAINATNDVLDKYDCEDNECPASAEDDLNIAKLNGNLSTAGFVIGGVGLAAGIVLFLFSDMGPGGGDDKEDTVEALVGPGYLGVTGRF
jgi:tetratricopeptide (TPR) repeat protein